MTRITVLKTPEDYDTVKFMVEDTQYTPYYEALEDYNRYLGDDGLVITALPYTPFQKMLIEWVGPTQLYRDYARHRDKVDELYQATAEKYREMYSIVADAPVEYVNFGDNIDAVMVNPPIFEKYHPGICKAWTLKVSYRKSLQDLLLNISTRVYEICTAQGTSISCEGHEANLDLLLNMCIYIFGF